MTLRFNAPRRSHCLATLPSLLLAAVTLGLSGCDNPICVFADGCTSDSDGPGTGDNNSMGAASGRFPGLGSFLAPAAPEFLRGAPGGVAATAAHSDTAIFLEFSESLNPASLANDAGSAFQVIATQSGFEIPMIPAQLVGDGRVVVLLPVMEYPELQSYQVFFREGQEIADLNGQLLGDENTDALVEFSVDSASVEDTPRVIYSYPPDSSINNANTSEIVIGFDRSMDGTTIDRDSFAVTVDGVTPTENPEPQALTIGGLAFVNQVFLWTPQDGDELLPYGLDGDVVVQLSSSPDEIVSTDGNVLPLTETAFTTSDFTLPAAVAKAADARPQDAFGGADTSGSGNVIEVTLDAEPPAGTEAELYLFGVSPEDPIFTRTLLRTVAVPAGVTTFSVTSDELQLIDPDGDVQFSDGRAQIAVVLRNGGARSAVRRFDADPSTDAIESPIFDTTPPVLLGLGLSGEVTDSLVGEVRDFSAFGRASEPIAFAFVDAGANGTNGGTVSDPPATAYSTLVPVDPTNTIPPDPQAYFMTTPVPVGVLDPGAGPVAYEITLFDQAFNSTTTTVMGNFSQRGVVGPGGAPTGSTVAVRVFDAITLAPIENALVLSYQELSGGITFVDDGLTMGGAATVDGAGTGSTIITVDAAGYDLFSFHGVPRDAVDIMLTPTMLDVGVIEGQVSGAALGGLAGTDRFVQDTRTLLPKRFEQTGSCATNSSVTNCVFDDFPVRSGRLGAVSVISTLSSTVLSPVNAPLFLVNFALGAPFGPVGPGEEFMHIALDAGAGIGISAPADELSTFFGATAFSLGGLTEFGTLQGDLTVTVEAAATGLAGPLLVGAGQATVTGTPTTFAVISAVAGVAAPGGSLEMSGAISPASFMRISASDMAGNEVAARPREGSIGTTTVPLDVPSITNPVSGSMTGGSVYNILLADAMPDSSGLTFGLYKVHLTDTTGRGWTLVGLDTSDAAGGTIVISVQDIAAQGGMGLQNGEITATVELYAQDLDRGQFLWTDLEREHEFYSRTAPITFTQN